MPSANTPVVPTEITVHLGRPDAYAENITVPFTDYIKNVASGEIYPTWPENAIRANIYAIISYTLNRIYTEYYRSMGYNFDITNSTAFDQTYTKGREYFENIGLIVDDIFNNYIVKGNAIEPYFAQYCNGTTTTCDGLSQWGTVTLANEGKTPFGILQNYYGDNISIVFNAPVQEISESYTGVPLRLGSSGNEVRIIQVELNRIRQNYPSIPEITKPDGIFGVETENAVKEFQKIFNLTTDGIVGKATWYKIKSIYNGVKNLNELSSEGITYDEAAFVYPQRLALGDDGFYVSYTQYYLMIIGYFNDNYPYIDMTGVFDEQTENAIKLVQEYNGLEVTGAVNIQTWRVIQNLYMQTVETVRAQSGYGSASLYPGIIQKRGMSGESVREIQTYLTNISEAEPSITPPSITGYFGSQTENAVRQFQRANNLPENGVVGAITWARMSKIYDSMI